MGLARMIWRRKILIVSVLAGIAIYLVGANFLFRQQVNEASPIAPSSQSSAAPAAAPASTQPGTQAGGQQAASTTKVVQTGQWKGMDAAHRAAGSAQIIQTAPGKFVLRVEQFSVTNGPDLFVVLSPKADGYADGALNLGKLKGTDGAFNYEIPDGTDLSKFKSAVVWCRAFNVTFGSAALSAM